VNPSRVITALKDALNLSRPQILSLYELLEYPMSRERLDRILKNPSNKRSITASYEELGLFLDALILQKRKESPKVNESDEEIELTNNLIFKKIRVALNLKEYEIAIIFELADYRISKSQIKDLFRSPKHPKYRECSDKTLAAFLEGLNEFYFESGEYL